MVYKKFYIPVMYKMYFLMVKVFNTVNMKPCVTCTFQICLNILSYFYPALDSLFLKADVFFSMSSFQYNIYIVKLKTDMRYVTGQLGPSQTRPLLYINDSNANNSEVF